MAQIICRDLSFAYDGETVLSDINFSLDAGAYLCIVGENGSGKSTLMRGLLGLKTPSTGTITFNDLKPTEIGYLPQQTQIQRDFPASVREVVLSGRLNSMHGRLFYNAADKAAAAENMERLGIDDIADRCYLELSGGQQQRVLLARAMCATKKLLPAIRRCLRRCSACVGSAALRRPKASLTAARSFCATRCCSRIWTRRSSA